jgi:L-threonylcarbamoyladenylate synthase
VTVAAAVDALAAGLPVVIPTDTVYGIAALPSLQEGVAAIFVAKGRRLDKPLPVLGASIEDLEAIVVVDDRARALGARYWPGPLTLVLPRAPGFDADLGGDRRASVAVRVPRCDEAQEVLRAAGPLAVTSANRSGDPPATTVDAARRALGRWVHVYVDGGRRAAAPSTIISLVGPPTVLRVGELPRDEVLAQAAYFSSR